MGHQHDAMLWPLKVVIMNIIKTMKNAYNVIHNENKNVKYLVHQNYMYAHTHTHTNNIYINI